MIECLVECYARKQTKDFCLKKFGQKVLIKEGNYNDVIDKFMLYTKNLNYQAIEDYLEKSDFGNIIYDLTSLLNSDIKEIGKIVIDFTSSIKK